MNNSTTMGRPAAPATPEAAARPKTAKTVDLNGVMGKNSRRQSCKAQLIAALALALHSSQHVDCYVASFARG